MTPLRTESPPDTAIATPQTDGVPPGPARRIPGHFAWDLFRDRLGLFAEMAGYGDVSQITVARGRPVVLLMHPDDIQRMLVTEQRSFTKGRSLRLTRFLLGDGLLTSEGDTHLRQRRLVQPAFHRERLGSYASMMVGLAERTSDQWRPDTMVNVHDEMMHLTLAIAGRTLFDIDIEKDARDIVETLDLSLRLFDHEVVPTGMLTRYLPLPWILRLYRARRRTDRAIARLIQERRASGTDRGDLLSMLIAARDTEGDGGGMTDQQLRDEIITLLMAGHETTSNALTWTWYLLSRNPEVEAKLHAELDGVLGGRSPDISDLPRLTYARNVLAESMRLFPPAWILEREPVRDFEAGGHTIRPGALILASQFLVHRDPRWWPEPERFDPDRWSDDDGRSRPRFAYFPFGGGTRICAGERFAWMEGTLVLATLASRWRPRYEQATEPVPEPLVTLRPKGGLRMRILAR